MSINKVSLLQYCCIFACVLMTSISFADVMRGTSYYLTSDVIDAAGITNVDDANIPKTSIKKVSFSMGQVIAGLANGSTYKGKLGFLYTYEVAESSDVLPPSAISDLVASGSSGDVTSEGSLMLRWTAPGNDDTAGTAYSYNLRYSSVTNINTNTEFDDSSLAKTIDGQFPPSPEVAGSTQSMVVVNLVPGATYFFAIRALDAKNSGVWSRSTGINENNFAVAYDSPPPVAIITDIVQRTSELRVFWSTTAVTADDISHYELWCDSVTSEMSSKYLVLTTTGLEYAHTGLTNDVTYYYQVITVDNLPLELKSQPSNTLESYPSAGIIPDAPQMFNGYAAGVDSIVWEWTAVGEVTGYRIYSSSSLVVTELMANDTYWIQGGLTQNTPSDVKYIVSYNTVVGESARKNLDTSYPVFTYALPAVGLEITEATVSKVTLQWTANGNPENTRYGIQYSGDDFTVDITTYSTNVLQTTATVYGLSPGNTYYFRVHAYNGNGIQTGYSNVVSTLTAFGIAPGSVTDLRMELTNSTSIQLTWTAPGADGTIGDLANATYIIAYSDIDSDGITTESEWNIARLMNEFRISTTTVLGAAESVIITGLMSSTTYSFSIKVIDSGDTWSGLSNSLVAWTVNTEPPGMPTQNTAVVDTTNKTITLNWLNPEDTDFRGVLVVWRTDRAPENAGDGTVVTKYGVPGTTDSYKFTNLTWGTTYYVAMYAFDSGENYSVPVSTNYTFIPLEAIPPNRVLGLRGESTGTFSYSLYWTKVTNNIDGTICTDLAKYQVYRGTSMFSCNEPRGVILSTSSITDRMTYTEYYAGGRIVYYYRVVAVDLYDNASDSSWVVDNTEDANIYIITGDKKAWAVLTSNAARVLYKDLNNSYNANLDIFLSLDEETGDAYTMNLFNSLTEESIDNFRFPSPGPLYVFVYDTAQFADTDSIVVNRNNGIEWVAIGGSKDTSAKTVSVRYIYSGTFKLQKVEKSDKFEVTKITSKIFTPQLEDETGVLNRARFYCNNPKGSKTVGKVFNLMSALVQDKLDVESEGNGVTVLYWDGKDKSGKVVDSGVYIYQIEADGRVQTGTVVVAK
ncbi:MAG: fibronectin type III domain-containing protein [Elusimicrobiota bacterium]